MKLYLKRNIPNARALRRRALIVDAILTWAAVAAALWLLLARG